jgi:alcohol dehydrogenase class IV
MLPNVAIIDPLLTVSNPREVTIRSAQTAGETSYCLDGFVGLYEFLCSCGLDAFTQCLEPFVSNLANPITDSFCREGLKRAARSLQVAFDN